MGQVRLGQCKYAYNVEVILSSTYFYSMMWLSQMVYLGQGENTMFKKDLVGLMASLWFF